jgi:hypothetical protein
MKNMFNIKKKAPEFCDGKEYPYTVNSGIPMPDYWVVLKDFSYNKKQDRYVCSTSNMQTSDYVPNTELKKGDLLKRNFRYENAIQNMVANGVITEASKNKSSSLGFGDHLKNKKWLVYGLIAVAGYFAYKKFK